MFSGFRTPRTPAVWLFLLFALVPAYSSSADYQVRVAPLPYWKELSAEAVPFKTSTMIEASLTASGLSGSSLHAYETKYRTLIDNFRKDELPQLLLLDNKERGDALLTWMHRTLLHRYALEQTLMNVLIDRETFNCVSSSIIYMLLARISKLTVGGVETKDHVFCRVKTDSGWVDVETTSPFGFNPGTKKEFVKDFRRTGFTYVPPGHYAYRRVIQDREVVALILQNRIALLQKQNRHAEAVGLAVDRWTLTGVKKHFTDMNNAFRNWAATLNNRGMYTEALHFMSAVSRQYGLLQENHSLMYGLAYNNLVAFLHKELYLEARNSLAEEKPLLSPRDMAKLEKILLKSSLDTTVRRKTFEESMPQVQKAYREGLLTQREWSNYMVYLYRKKAASMANTRDYYTSWKFLSGAPEEIRNMAEIKRMRSALYHNWTARIHNSFVEKIRLKNVTAAQAILTKGLAMDPGNTVFLKDLSDLKKVEQNR